ncbi:MAG TPA: ABC transporter permease [Candidatus Binatia bacterium]|nr:ABC transporter permease [Candidatus Binatia bacterium]
MIAPELVRLALQRLAAARLRTLLTALGVIIGVAAVVALVGVGQGATRGITARLQGLGTNLLTITPGGALTGFTRGAAGSAQTLTLADADALAAIPTVAAVAPEITSQQLVVAGRLNTTTQIIGTTPAFQSVRAYEIWQGSFLTDLAVDEHLRVAVLGATVADDLGLGPEAIGSEISIGGLPFEIIGILQPKGSSGPFSQDDQVLIPITTLQRLFSSSNVVRTIGVSVATLAAMDETRAEITALLRQRHGLDATAADDFTIQDQAQLLSTVSDVSTTLSILLAGIASISLVVGGIGIMNIMLVSVRERTREIGIRKAIGARERDILLQFLVEALTLSILGGLIGAVVGIGISALIGVVAGWGFMVSPWTIVVALGFSVLVGVVFGVWPARQAARLDPIVALRYE